MNVIQLLASLVILAVTQKVSAEIVIQTPTIVEGKVKCAKGFFLVSQNACVNQNATAQHSVEEISTELLARKDPEAAKKYREALAIKKATGTPVFKTQITEENNTIYKLMNGGIVEIKFSYVGYLGYGKKVLLFSEPGGWKLWIQDKKTFSVEILKAPTASPTYVTTIGEVLELLE
jgi:hypothetical protein